MAEEAAAAAAAAEVGPARPRSPAEGYVVPYAPERELPIVSTKGGPDDDKVLIILTGGTIGMVRNDDGHFTPQEGYLTKALFAMDEFRVDGFPALDILEFSPLLDSSCFSPADWKRIARYIHRSYGAYVGFLILCGTDTMAYTASALSFMLENLGKPVILSGSQIPIGEAYNDARRNLIFVE